MFFLLLDFLLKGCFFAYDIFTFFIFFESILVVILYLIGVLGTHERKVKAIYFFYVYTLVGSFLILLGILIFFFEAGSSNLFVLSNLNLFFKKQIFL
jgi:NADH-quinone oxidoreductase subunit M